MILYCMIQEIPKNIWKVSKKCLLFTFWYSIILNCQVNVEGFPSGQRGQTVNLLATPSKVRILLPPLRADVAELADARDLKSRSS
jgi:hypothetical protein